MPDHDMHKQYAKCMEKRPEGHALWENVSAAKLMPGACGYFDTQGDWQTIVQTTNAEALSNLGLPLLNGIRTWKDDGESHWRGPLMSEGVKGHRVNLNVHGADPSQTVVAGTKLEFTSSKTRSAILIADGIVEHHQAAPATKFLDWGTDNAQALIDASDDRAVIKKKGFWIVTKTFTAARCSISYLEGKDSKSSYGISAGTQGMRVAPTAEWWSSQRDGNWRDLTQKEGGHVVMFMSGIWWQPRFLSSKMKAVMDAEKQKWLAGEESPIPAEVSIPSETPASPEYYQFTPAVIGEDDPDTSSLCKAMRSPYDDNIGDDENFEESEDESDDE